MIPNLSFHARGQGRTGTRKVSVQEAKEEEAQETPKMLGGDNRF
jgi:hypothetical protein